MENRVFQFGKYKGEDIKYVILTDVSYVAWCLANIPGFILSDEEWELYDDVAVMFKKYGIEPTVKEEVLYRYVKDKEKLRNLSTPLMYRHGFVTATEGNDELREVIDKYKVPVTDDEGTGWELICYLAKLVEKDMLPEETEFYDWSSVYDYEDW